MEAAMGSSKIQAEPSDFDWKPDRLGNNKFSAQPGGS
jgi:hypothetical protein